MDNSILTFHFPTESNKSVRVIMRDGEPWFVAKDVCDVLEQPNISQVVSRLDDDEKGLHNVETLGGQQEMSIINESGLYSLILTSRKPEAKAFKRWVTHDVLPSIRKTGKYEMPESQKCAPNCTLETLTYAQRESISNRVYKISQMIDAGDTIKSSIYTNMRATFGVRNSYSAIPAVYYDYVMQYLEIIELNAREFMGLRYALNREYSNQCLRIGKLTHVHEMKTKYLELARELGERHAAQLENGFHFIGLPDDVLPH